MFKIADSTYKVILKEVLIIILANGWKDSEIDHILKLMIYPNIEFDVLSIEIAYITKLESLILVNLIRTNLLVRFQSELLIEINTQQSFLKVVISYNT
jgi:hypothetical protein